MTDTKEKTTGQIAYEAFANSQTFPRLPVWDSLTDNYRASWAVVERAVAEPLIDELNRALLMLEELGHDCVGCARAREVIARYEGRAA